MVDTARTKADLIANLFQDGQPAGSVTPQDMRDLIESLADPHFHAKVDTPAETTIVTQDVFVKAAGTTSIVEADRWSQTSNGTWRYDGVVTKPHIVMAFMTWSPAANNKELRVQIAKNGTPIADTEQRRLLTSTSDFGSLSAAGDISLATNDTIEIHCANATDTVNFTLQNLTLIARGIFA